MAVTPETKSLKSNTKKGGLSMSTVFVVGIILELVSQGQTLHYVISMFRSLQIMLNLPLMRILIPPNVNMVHELLIPIVMFDILPEGYMESTSSFDLDEHDIQREQIYPQMVDLGYESYNYILNLGSLSIIFWLYAIKLIYVAALYLFNRFTKGKYIMVKNHY